MSKPTKRIQFREDELKLLDDLLHHLDLSGTEHDLLHGRSDEVQREIGEARERSQKKIRRALRKLGYHYRSDG